MKTKVCPLTIINGNPMACRSDCAWFKNPPLGEKHCAILDVSQIPEALSEVNDTLKNVGATIAANRR